MNRSITVSAYNRDPLAKASKKYESILAFPSTQLVYDTRYTRETCPDTSQLTPLAKWLVEHCPGFIGRSRNVKIECSNGKRKIDMIRSDRGDEYADAMAAAYGSELMEQLWVDWLFPQINPNETDNDYWNRVAAEMIAAGTTAVRIRGQVFEL